MRFEARELKGYAEPVSREALRKGHVYFSLNFADEEMCVPILEPVVFIGTNLQEGDVDKVYFQDYESFHSQPDTDLKQSVDGVIFSGAGDELNHIFAFDKALDLLLECSIRRRRLG